MASPKSKKKSDNLIPVRGAIYARYSSHSQREESIEQQIAECSAFAQANGIDIVGIYADKAISGRTDKRNEFQRLMADAEKRKFEVVLAYKSNRIARNMLNALQSETTLKMFGIQTLYVKEDFGNTAAGRFAMRSMMNINQFYSENMAEDIRRGLKDNAEQCKVNGSLPYGYKRGEDGKYVIDEPKAAIVREIFRRVASGDRYSEIIDSLNERGFTTKRGNPWGKNSFHRMLTNERYIGVYEYSGIRKEDGVPAIIPKEVFYMVQDKLNEGTNEQGLKRKMNAEYLLTGKLFCGECGSPMVGISGTSRNGELHYYYTCKKNRGKKGCEKHNIRRDFLEQVVVDMTLACINDAELIDWLVRNYIELKKKILEDSDIPLMEQDLKENKKALSNLLKAVEAGIFNETTAERMKELENEIKMLERSISLEKVLHEESFDGEKFLFYIEKLKEGHPDNVKYRKEIFKTFVRCVRLWDDRIEIEYYFTGSDDGGKPHIVTKDFSPAEEDEAPCVRTDTPQGHHCKAVRTRHGKVSVYITESSFVLRSLLPSR